MSEPITILDEFPIILTKDVTWKLRAKVKAGSILVLPDDAVLVSHELWTTRRTTMPSRAERRRIDRLVARIVKKRKAA